MDSIAAKHEALRKEIERLKNENKRLRNERDASDEQVRQLTIKLKAYANM